MIDLLIAGGGPAGLATAIFAAKEGMRVVVVEPHRGPIDKACGEGIMPGGRALLGRMGVDTAPGRSLTGVRYHQNGLTAAGRFRHGSGVGMRRIDLSRALWNRAADLAVERHQGRVREVEFSDDRVSSCGLEARWLVGADGLNSAVRQLVGIHVETVPSGRFGVRRHFETDEDSDYVDVYLADAGEAYVTPVSRGIVGVAILSSRPQRFEDGLAGFPELQARLGDPVGDIRGAGPFRRFASHATKANVALVGDAAGFLDPITGEGIRLGFQAAELLVDCLRRNRLKEYEAGWRRIVRRYRLVTSGLLALRRNRYLNGAIVPTLRRLPGLFDGMLELLGSA